MKIQQYSMKNNSINQPTFNELHVIDSKVQKLLLTSLEPKQLDMLSQLIKKEENNSIHILLDSKNGKLLNASLICFYKLKILKLNISKYHFLNQKFIL